MTCFEYDRVKSERNLEKHGIDFQDARQLWSDPDLLEIPAKVEDEPRFPVIGRIAGKHWSAVITYRQERVRIISARRSRKDGVRFYESKTV